MDWESVDWDALAVLREVFLGRSTGAERAAPYWENEVQLASYDFTFGRRIAWKWAAVLDPLLAAGWQPPSRTLVDWGCGTAIAARSLLAHAAPGSFDEVILWDHAPAATRFAVEAIQARQPGVRTTIADPVDRVANGDFVLVVSHVLNELDAAGRDALLALAAKAAAVLWVEPGTFADSRALIAVRETLRGQLHTLAPCPHDASCGLLAAENAQHWCHHFARPPTEAFTDSGWSAFSRFLGIDLRSLPYSYLVLDRHAPVPRPGGLSRVIGTPRESSGLMRILRCRSENVAEVELFKRHAPALWRTLGKGRHGGLFAWAEEDGRIRRGGEAALPCPPSGAQVSPPTAEPDPSSDEPASSL